MRIDSSKLTPIAEISQLVELRDLYRHDWPINAVGYYCLDNFLRWQQREPSVKNLHVYTTKTGDWRVHGLVLIVDRYQLFVQCLHSDMHQLVVDALSGLDWTSGVKISSLAERHRNAVLEVVATKQLTLEYDSLTLMYYMPYAVASLLEIKCPNGFDVRPLSESDAAEIDNLWPNKHVGSLFLVKRLIAWNINMGVYVTGTNELVAWCLRLQGGFLGALQVKESHKRLGLGTLVARATTRRIAEVCGDDVMALVNPDNSPSRGMFDKLGFRVTGKCYWIRTYGTSEGIEWPTGE